MSAEISEVLASSAGSILGGQLAVLRDSPERSHRTPVFHGLSFDPFWLVDNGWGPAEAGIRMCHVAQAIVVTLVVVILDASFDLALKVARLE